MLAALAAEDELDPARRAPIAAFWGHPIGTRRACPALLRDADGEAEQVRRVPGLLHLPQPVQGSVRRRRRARRRVLSGRAVKL